MLVIHDKSIPIQVTSDDTIELVKAIVANKAYLERDEFHLVHDNKRLDEDKTIGDHKIQKDDEIHVVKGALGGGKRPPLAAIASGETPTTTRSRPRR